MALTPGTRLGVYEVTAQIGEGGMGEVYRATDTTLNRQVAIKVLPESLASDAERIARFEREAKTLASLNHPNIAAIYGFEKSSGVHALVMELVEGPTLADRIAQGAIPVDEALPIAKQIAEALEAAHEQGIIHRDLKPANVKLRPDGVVKVLDFGLAKALEPAGAMSPGMSQAPTITTPAMTQAGMILGTAAYMSPEQAKGRTVDKRSDIWAFGAVLYEMLSGKRVFGGDDISDTLANVLKTEPDWSKLPANVPARVRQAVRGCLQKDLNQRVHDIADVRLALEGVFESGVSQGEAATVAQPMWRRALPLAFASLVTALVVGLAAWSLWPTSNAPRSVTRFDYVLPEGQQFRAAAMIRPLMTFSPDGRHFVYNTNEGLYLRAMGDLETRLIPGTEEALANPFFSPAGDSVGYWQEGELRRIAISGGAPVVICAATNPIGATWGPDGTIFFGQPEGIMRVPATGGTPALVIPAAEGERVHGAQLLPDGESVLFSVTTATGNAPWEQAQIVVQSLSTGEQTVVLQGGTDARYVPTGHLVYALGLGLFAVAFDADRLEVQGGPVSLVEGVLRAGGLNNQATGDYGPAANYGVSNQGTLVYVRDEGVQGLRTLVWVDRSGTETVIQTVAQGYDHPRVSPDGTRVAVFVITGESDIWLWDLNRTTLTRVTFDPGADLYPVWTPDGRRLLFTSNREDNTRNLFWKAADGTGDVERLTESSNWQHASAVSPDGRLLIFSEDFPETGWDVMQVELDGAQRVTPLVQTQFIERNGIVSPDGRWLAYEANDSGRFEIYVRPFPDVDSGRSQISTLGGTRPLWARSGQELFYISPTGAIMRTEVGQGPSWVATTPALLVATEEGYRTNPPGGAVGRTYDITPDGERFLTIKEGSAAIASSQIIVVENWFEELRQRVPTN